MFKCSTHQTLGIKQTRVTRKVNAFDTPSERVSHVKQTRLCLRANAFHTRSKRVYCSVRTRFTREANAFIVLFERVSHEKQTRLSFRANAFHSRANAFISQRPRALTRFSRRRVRSTCSNCIISRPATRVSNVQGARSLATCTVPSTRKNEPEEAEC